MSNETALREFAFELDVHEYGPYQANSIDEAKNAFAADAGYGTWEKMIGQEFIGDNFRVYEVVNGRRLEIRD